MIWTRPALVAHLAAGNAVDFLFFWGHAPKVVEVIDASCLSQWFPAPFTLAGVTYATAEHYMMAEKARLFRDDDAFALALEAPTPAAAKAAGRAVKNYDNAAWGRARMEAVITGNVAKFTQNEAMGAFLRSTGARMLVEAAPRDQIWGIGMGANHPDARDPARWRGQNLLGFALVETRRRLDA